MRSQHRNPNEGQKEEDIEKKKTISIKYNENSGFVDWGFMWMNRSVALTADKLCKCSMYVVTYTYMCIPYNIQFNMINASYELHSRFVSGDFNYNSLEHASICVIRFQHMYINGYELQYFVYVVFATFTEILSAFWQQFSAACA